jgi:hypothetical protein
MTTTDIQITATKSEGAERRLRVAVPPARVAEARSKATSRVAKQVRIPGFRPGKAPAAMVRKQYGQAIDQEAVDVLLKEAFEAVLAQEKLDLVTQPHAHDVKFGEDDGLSFELHCEVRPELKLERLDGFREVAKRVGKNRATVANALRLLQLESEIRRSLVAGEISEGHARALLGLPEGRGRVNAWRDVVKRKLSVRDTEGYVRRALAETPASVSSPGAQTARRDSAYSDIETRLRRALSTRVKVEPQKKGAKIIIECYSTEEFENVVSSLLGEYQ